VELTRNILLLDVDVALAYSVRLDVHNMLQFGETGLRLLIAKAKKTLAANALTALDTIEKKVLVGREGDKP
jgi:hypothetical protein